MRLRSCSNFVKSSAEIVAAIACQRHSFPVTLGANHRNTNTGARRGEHFKVNKERRFPNRR